MLCTHTLNPVVMLVWIGFFFHSSKFERIKIQSTIFNFFSIFIFVFDFFFTFYKIKIINFYFDYYLQDLLLIIIIINTVFYKSDLFKEKKTQEIINLKSVNLQSVSTIIPGYYMQLGNKGQTVEQQSPVAS